MQTLDSSSGESGTRLRVLLVDTARWAAPARLAIGLSKSGASVSVLCPTRHPALKARAITKAFHFESLHPLDSLQRAMEASKPAIVIPCDDRSVGLLHELYERACSQGRSEITNLISRSLGAPGSFSTVSSRNELLKIAREEGILVPDTFAIEAPEDVENLVGTQRFPWVMKVDGTSGGHGVRFVQTGRAAEQFFWEAKRWYRTARIVKRLIVNRDRFVLRPWRLGVKPAVTAQAYIQGRPANCAVVCWEGGVLAGIGVEVVSAEGSTGPASVVRLVDNPEMMLAAERIAKRLNLSGFFGLDFVLQEDTNKAYLIEMNPRCTPLCHLQLGKGRDMVSALYAQLSGQPLQELPPVTQNDLIAYFPQAWVSNSEFLQSSFQDIPWEEDELTKELLRPWPNRSSIYVVYQFLWTRLFQPASRAEQ